MKMITQKLKDTLKGVLVATATWMIILPLSERIVEFVPIKDTLVIGFVILVAVLLWEGRK